MERNNTSWNNAGNSDGENLNVDETGLFWKLLPERTLQFKGNDCKSGKHANDRITVLNRYTANVCLYIQN